MIEMAMVKMILDAGYGDVYKGTSQATYGADSIVVKPATWTCLERMERCERGRYDTSVLVSADTDTQAAWVADEIECVIRESLWENLRVSESERIEAIKTTKAAFLKRDGNGKFVYAIPVEIVVTREW